jgi:hypothetical protein
MSNTKKQKGIIYRAFNKISGKSYIGQTSQPLTVRISNHFQGAKYYTHKFSNALKYYSSDSWEWTILVQVEIEKLDEMEIFFIQDLDTYENGYNSTKGGQLSYNYNETVYELYHLEHGHIKGTRAELMAMDYDFRNICSLVKGRRQQIKGWVLLKNKELLEKGVILSTDRYITLTHDIYGTITASRKDFIKKYNLHRKALYDLISGREKSYFGWKLGEK